MKKSLSLISLLFLFSSSFIVKAQSEKMEIYKANGELIENGAFMYSVGSQTSKKISTDSLFIKNISGEAIKLKVKKVIIDVAAGTSSEFHALTQYVAPNKDITPDYWVLEDGFTTPDSAYFFGSYIPSGITKTSHIVFSFLSVDDNDKVLDSVYVNYTFSNTSLTPSNSNDGVLYNREILIDCDPVEINEYPVSLYNHSSNSVSFRVVKSIISQEDGHENYFSFGGVDYNPEDMNSDGNGVTIASETILEGANGFVAKFNPNGIDGNEFLTSVQYRFFNKLNGQDEDFVTLIYNPSGVGFNDLSSYVVSSAYPNPASNYFNINFSLPTFKEATLNVYQENGSLIGKNSIYNTEGTIKVATDSFLSGIYFYTIEIDGRVLQAQKVIIQN